MVTDALFVAGAVQLELDLRSKARASIRKSNFVGACSEAATLTLP